MIFLQSWAELIQLIFIVPAMILAIWDLIIDIQDKNQDKLIKNVRTELLVSELRRRNDIP